MFQSTLIFLYGCGFDSIKIGVQNRVERLINQSDFPLPDTPVTQIILPKGNSIETFFKLFPVTQVSFRIFHFPLRFCRDFNFHVAIHTSLYV
jgi:hypothetical protein